MSLEITLSRLVEQYTWEPVVEHSEALRPHKYVIVCGMGGSHLGAWLLQSYGAASHILIHRDYGLPNLPQEVYDNAIIILSSYSGTTEEVLDSAREALARGLPMAAISTGGKLLEFAKEHAIPHVQLPELGLEPRLALGFSAIGIARLMGASDLEAAVRSGGRSIDPLRLEEAGRRLGEKLLGKVPLIYTSDANSALGYIWKIKFNENAKIPSFSNVFPEMCHNELTGFDVVEKTMDLSSRMFALFLSDPADHPRVAKRMEVAEAMLTERNIPVERIEIEGKGFGGVFASAILCDWATVVLADAYGVPNPETPMVAEFKKRIGQ